MPTVFSERLTPDNATLAMIDHQTGLLVNCRDLDPHLLKANVRGLCQMAKTLALPSITTASMQEGPNVPIMSDITERIRSSIAVARSMPGTTPNLRQPLKR